MPSSSSAGDAIRKTQAWASHITTWYSCSSRRGGRRRGRPSAGSWTESCLPGTEANTPSMDHPESPAHSPSHLLSSQLEDGEHGGPHQSSRNQYRQMPACLAWVFSPTIILSFKGKKKQSVCMARKLLITQSSLLPDTQCLAPASPCIQVLRENIRGSFASLRPCVVWWTMDDRQEGPQSTYFFLSLARLLGFMSGPCHEGEVFLWAVAMSRMGYLT